MNREAVGEMIRGFTRPLHCGSPEWYDNQSTSMPAANPANIFQSNLVETSFRHFYEKYGRAFWNFIRKMCGDDSLADDISQESFLRFLEKVPPQLKDHQKKSYLYKIAVRIMRDRYKHMRVEDKYRAQLLEDENGKTDRTLLSMEMDQLFFLLKPPERTLLWLAYVEGYTHREISLITDLREAGVRVKLHRVRKKFAKILRANGFSEEEPS